MNAKQKGKLAVWLMLPLTLVAQGGLKMCFGLRSVRETPLARRVRISWPIR